jgi:two-component system LytT family response regulator
LEWPDVRALIVDDEGLARRRIRRLLRPHRDVEIAGDCGSGSEAIEMAHDLVPDLLFLDVQMPDLDGFAVLRALGSRRPAAVVFTTAYDEYAVRAFEVSAVDYLTKPIARSRFDAAVERARAALSGADRPATQARLRDALVRLAARPARLVVKRDGRAIFVDPDEISWVEAERNDVRLHTTRGSFRYHEPISRVETRLDPARFVRVHRSSIVNVDRIAELQPWFRGDGILIMKDGARVTLSRTYRPKLAAILGGL